MIERGTGNRSVAIDLRGEGKLILEGEGQYGRGNCSWKRGIMGKSTLGERGNRGVAIALRGEGKLI